MFLYTWFTNYYIEITRYKLHWRQNLFGCRNSDVGLKLFIQCKYQPIQKQFLFLGKDLKFPGKSQCSGARSWSEELFLESGRRNYLSFLEVTHWWLHPDQRALMWRDLHFTFALMRDSVHLGCSSSLSQVGFGIVRRHYFILASAFYLVKSTCKYCFCSFGRG